MIAKIRREIDQLVYEFFNERECVALLVREPIIDPFFPDTSDVDMLLIDMDDDMGVENIRRMKNGIRFDIMAMSAKLLLHDEYTRDMGTLPHQLISCTVVKQVGNWGTRVVQRMRDIMADPISLQPRIRNHVIFSNQILMFLDRIENPSEGFAYLTPVCSGYVGALAEGNTSLINVHTKPFTKLAKVNGSLLPWFDDVWKLKRFDPDDLLELGEAVVDEYKDFTFDKSTLNREAYSCMRYFPHDDELVYRLSVIDEMLKKGDWMDAAHYGRVYGLCLILSQWMKDHINEVDKKTNFYRKRKSIVGEVKHFDLVEKLFPFNQEEFQEAMDRIKNFRVKKLCPILQLGESSLL